MTLWLQSILDEFLNCLGAEARPWKDSGAVANIAERDRANLVVNILLYYKHVWVHVISVI